MQKIDVAYQRRTRNSSKQTIRWAPSSRTRTPPPSIPPPSRARLFSSLESRPSRRRNADKGFNSVRMSQRAKIGRLDRMGWKGGGMWLRKGMKWEEASIDELAETMVNFASNRLIPGLPSYVHRISIFFLFFLYFFSFLFLFFFISNRRSTSHRFSPHDDVSWDTSNKTNYLLRII